MLLGTRQTAESLLSTWSVPRADAACNVETPTSLNSSLPSADKCLVGELRLFGGYRRRSSPGAGTQKPRHPRGRRELWAKKEKRIK
jgi:hypothetical protein